MIKSLYELSHPLFMFLMTKSRKGKYTGIVKVLMIFLLHNQDSLHSSCIRNVHVSPCLRSHDFHYCRHVSKMTMTAKYTNLHLKNRKFVPHFVHNYLIILIFISSIHLHVFEQKQYKHVGKALRALRDKFY